MDLTFGHIAKGNLIYRQVFCDRARIPKDKIHLETPFDLDFQYKLYYQFVRHSFGIQSLPLNAIFHLHLDHHSSKKHQQSLKSFASNIPSYVGREDIRVELSYITHSIKHDSIQLADLIAGAAGSHANKMHAIREPNQHGMKPKQKLRHELAKYTYNHLRNMRFLDVGSKTFNWFETTGGFNHDNALNQKVRVWKFKPSAPYYHDKGWENDHLDAQGNYQGPDIIRISPI